ncbi:MAG TPA: DUF115 domain-containing protein [Sulfuricurvum sp.]|nr:MAG: hypothetical protein B7Y30_08210 [Campylobacterales bacterium 16-40-21]OZA03479.1 MAG: hypothetical protein B7X89_05660 [Sulfuricurvum sp. 17-40-25]HQS66669.1 DUF115 domain-containing protein [Sulfuricurvum sp.]HQT36525.1 DUF115 domain-containing protein [Sulfuricurvum sp.]
MNETSISLDTVYGKNIQALFSVNSALALEIFSIQENKQFELFQGEDPVAINLLDLNNHIFMYDNPVSDVLTLSESKQSHSSYHYRYIYGIANGIYLKMALDSSAIKRIVLFESNYELLYIVFNLIDFSKEITEEKLVIESTKEFDFTDAYQYFNEHESQLFARLFELEVSADYYIKTAYDNIAKITNVLTETLLQVVMGHGNCPIDSLMGIEHHFTNLPDMIKGPKFTKIFGKGQGDTVIIVSTGPSLTKQIPLLKKIQDHVTIISVDASFPILEKNGIKPDFVTVLERVPETGKFFENNSLEFQKDVNFVCVSIIHKAVKDAIRNGNLFLQMRPHGYTKYFGLDDYGYLGSGMSAANLAHELAVMLNFKNIIFIGQDLAFGEDNTSHAQDHTFTINEEKPEGHDIFTLKYGGEGTIRTTFYWNIFRNTIQDIIKKTASFITTINATEGGAHILGATEMPFAQAIEKYIDFSLTKQPLSIEYPDTEEVKHNTQQMIDKTNFILKEAVDKQEMIEDLFIQIQDASEKLVELNETNRLEDIDFDHLQELSDKLDEIKDIIDNKQFNQMFFDTIQSFMIHLEIDLAEVYTSNPQSDIEKKAKLIDWIMRHRYWLFVIAGGIDAQFGTIVKAIEQWSPELLEHITIPQKRSLSVDHEKYEYLKAKALKEEEALFELINSMKINETT